MTMNGLASRSSTRIATNWRCSSSRLATSATPTRSATSTSTLSRFSSTCTTLTSQSRPTIRSTRNQIPSVRTYATETLTPTQQAHVKPALSENDLARLLRQRNVGIRFVSLVSLSFSFYLLLLLIHVFSFLLYLTHTALT